jgi:hypothetical protein
VDEDQQRRDELYQRIERRRASIRGFLGRARPQQTRLTNVSIGGSALATALTAAPALGGTSFTTAVQSIFSLQESSTVWRVLCLCAALVSMAAALATHLSSSRGIAAQVSAAESCNAELEGLQLSLTLGHMPVEDVIDLYRQYLAKIPFVGDPEPH